MTPQTAAGRALAKQVASWTEFPNKYVDAILAIEAEALTAARERIEAKIAALRTLQPGETPYGTLVWLVDVQTVIRLAAPSDAPETCAGDLEHQFHSHDDDPSDAPEKP